ncbi:GH1 family beta-glucosidase [Micromonospora sp. RHAY321]|uniref:GH1 family beta-glucosidase n=1 Tax=Micromonospora sp. RHAY321 TaxID=2944807 RepID=UPI00207C7364|nr:GH1 family beta-glucosidase [Micromonospora sp. RHAY321]MCO1593914.1 GH1 family beta-glucosidase [Micromonospora sp. RHAY321]
MSDPSPRFPDGFVWGAATASYQVEGAVDADGRGRSIWDTFCGVPGAIAGGDTGAVACEHYHRYPEDIALMADLGLGAYRFSVAWPRIQPEGRGSANQKGLDHYRRVVDRLLERGIVPYVTLYHWDLPQALQDRGGWPARDTAYRFAEYAGVVHAALGDTVRHWITLNEPKVSSHAGYGSGIHAPGVRDLDQRDRAVHHLLLAHGLGLQALRANGAGHQVGITLDLSPVAPAGDSPDDLAASRRVDTDSHRLFLEPVLRGAYPSEVGAPFVGGTAAELVRPGDLELIGAPVDFLGINYYRRMLVQATPTGHLRAEVVVPDGVPVTDVGWPVEPDGLTELLVGLRAGYPELPPVYLTENGAAYPDTVAIDGTVHDPERVDYLHRHLLALHAAIRAGVDVHGYFVWTLMDNFEWAEGYAKRFGVVYVDYADQRRVPKTSARWYGRVARGNALPPR